MANNYHLDKQEMLFINNNIISKKIYIYSLKILKFVKKINYTKM